MSASPGQPATAVLPGRGTVTVAGSTVVLTPSSPTSAMVEAAVAAGDGTTDRHVALDRLRAIVADAPATAVAVRGPAGWLVAIGPDMRALVDQVGHRSHREGPVQLAPAGATRLALLPAGAPADGTAAVAPTHQGTRSGAGVVIEIQAVLGRPPASVVGVACTCGAFVHPLSVLCRACSQVLPTPRQLVHQPGVPVGRLVLDDGRALPLAGDVVIGRDPASAPVPGAEGAALLTLADAQRSVSRSHVVLGLDGWDVLLRDCRAANGTAVRPASSGGWTVLVPGAAVRLLPGTEVQLGRRTFRYVS